MQDLGGEGRPVVGVVIYVQVTELYGRIHLEGRGQSSLVRCDHEHLATVRGQPVGLEGQGPLHSAGIPGSGYVIEDCHSSINSPFSLIPSITYPKEMKRHKMKKQSVATFNQTTKFIEVNAKNNNVFPGCILSQTLPA